MNITDFSHDHITEAAALALFSYEEERRQAPALPPVETIPDLSGFADSNLSVAAFENGTMIGFLCFYAPWDHAFTTTARGTFSPIHAHGTVNRHSEMIYKRLYQAAAEKLIRMKVSSHAIGLYAHDAQAINAFFTYGFGLRCIDAIRPMEMINCAPCDGYVFHELAPDEKDKLLPLKNMLISHLGDSPTFMRFPAMDKTGLEKIHNRRKPRYFCAFQNDETIAFLEVMDNGENFTCSDKSMKNICGAFCLPEHRGKGVYQNLLNLTISTLKGEGYTRLGVDFESFNPTAYGFWLKYFTAYTYGVVRRIDERIFEMDT